MAKYDMTTFANAFRIKYEYPGLNAYNSQTVLLGRVKKKFDLQGLKKQIEIPTGMAGGVGAGSIPTSAYAAVSLPEITRNKNYAVATVDNEAIQASLSGGAIMPAIDFAAKYAIERFNNNINRQLFGDGTGALGTLSANASGTATAPVCTISASTWVEGNFELNDYLNAGTDAAVFQVTAIDSATRAVTLARLSGSLDLTAAGSGEILYIQNSKDAEIMGLKGITAASGTLYNVTIGSGWSSYRKDASSAGVSSDLLTDLMLGVEKRCGKAPNLLITSYTQFKKILNFMEDQKRFPVSPRDENLKGKVSYSAVEFMSTNGAVPIVPDRHCQEGVVYAVNDNIFAIHSAAPPKWFDLDGVWLRNSTDDYSARYGMYGQSFAIPTYCGVLHSLST